MYPNHYYNPVNPWYPNQSTNLEAYQSLQPMDQRIWVQGEAGMKAYLIAPGNSVILWDSESQTIWIKSADTSGRPSVQTLEYKVKEMPAAQNSAAAYVPIEDFKKLEARFEALEKGMKTNV